MTCQPGRFVPVDPEEHGYALEVFDVTKDDEGTFRWVRVIHPGDGRTVCSYMRPTPAEVPA
jgi:hypothetical protein